MSVSPNSVPALTLSCSGSASVMVTTPTVMLPAIAPATVTVGSLLLPVAVLLSCSGLLWSTSIRSIACPQPSSHLPPCVTSMLAVTPPRSLPYVVSVMYQTSAVWLVPSSTASAFVRATVLNVTPVMSRSACVPSLPLTTTTRQSVSACVVCDQS